MDEINYQELYDLLEETRIIVEKAQTQMNELEIEMQKLTTEIKFMRS